MYVYSESIFITLYTDIKHKSLKKLSSDKINGTKNTLFFFHVLQLVTDLLLIYDSYMSWSTRLVSQKLCVVFSIFDSVPFLFYLSLNFCSRKCMNPLTLKCQNVNWNNRNATHGFAPRRLIFKLQQEILKFNYICGNWSS